MGAFGRAPGNPARASNEADRHDSETPDESEEGETEDPMASIYARTIRNIEVFERIALSRSQPLDQKPGHWSTAGAHSQ